MTQENMLARYKILHELGRGAIGAVYAARDRETGAVVALKRLDPALINGSDAKLAERLLKHARSARLLNHANIARIHDAGEVAGTIYVAMEMLEGESVRKMLDRGPLPIARAIRIAHDLAGGLAYAHLEGVVHGGVKPSNIIVLPSGVTKTTDFGMGQLAQAALVSGVPAGCLSCMPPEQLRGDPIDHRCDLFALGALFYEMLTRRPPFAGDSPKEITENMLRGKPPLPSELNPHVPRALDAMVLSMLAADPAARPPGAPMLLRDLQRLQEGLGLGSGASAPTEQPAASVRRADQPVPGVRRARPEPRREGRDANEPGIRADSPVAEDFRPRDRTADSEPFDYHRAMHRMKRASRPERSSGSRRAFLVAFAVLGIGLAAFLYHSSSPGELGIAASRMLAALATAPESSGPTAAAAVAKETEQPVTAPGVPQASLPRAAAERQAEQGSLGPSSAPTATPPKALAAEPAPSAQNESSVASAPEPPASAGATSARDIPQAVPPAAEAPKPLPPGMARLIVAVSPRGEVYINGEHQGTAPPDTTFDLEPGMHRIEVRNGSRKPYLTYMTVQAGDVRRVRHDFDTGRAVHPPRTASSQQRRPAR